MAVTTFIPEVWSAKLMRALEKATVYAHPNVINRDYQGEITQAGDTVHIGTIGEVTIKAHDRTTDIDAAETLATTDQSLLIDKEKYFNFAVNDVDAAQVAGELGGKALQSAAYGLRDAADPYG